MFRHPLKRLLAGLIAAAVAIVVTGHLAQSYQWKIDPQQMPMIQLAVAVLLFFVVWIEAGEGLDFLENDSSIPLEKQPLNLRSAIKVGPSAPPAIPQLGLARLTGEESVTKPDQKTAIPTGAPPTIMTAENTRITDKNSGSEAPPPDNTGDAN